MKSYICVKLSNINYPIFANKKRDGKGVSGILSSCLIVFIHLRKTYNNLPKGSVLYIAGNHCYSMYKIINKYYPLWKIKKYGVEILFLWGSISIWTNGYFGK